MRAAALSCAASLLIIAAGAGGVSIAHAQEQDTGSAPDAERLMKDCEQTDSAPLVVRACSLILNGGLDGGTLEPAERVRLLRLRAVGWTKEDEFTAAAEDYAAILEIEKDDIPALEGRGKAWAKAGHFIESIADWTRLLDMQPANAGYYRQRGRAHLGARHHQDALADLEKAIEIDPQGMDAYVARAQVYSAMGDIESSKREFERGIAVDDRYIPLFWTRGEMAYEWGEKDLAIASYRRVLALNGVYEDARRRLQRLGIMHPP